MAAMQGYDSHMALNFYGKTKFLFSLAWDYDRVHVKNICFKCIAELSVINKFWFSIKAVIHNKVTFL